MSILKVEDKIYSVLKDGRQYEVHVERDGDRFLLGIGGRTHVVVVEDPRAWNASATSRTNSKTARVASPMPGKLIRLLVKVGDTVEQGNGLAVVEAMKMQNELKSPIGGVVRQIAVSEGATVASNQVLVTVEAE